MQGLPGSAPSVSTHARGLRPRRVRLRLARTASTVLPSACSERVGTREKRRFRGSILCLRVPLSTLRRHRYRCLRMTRGQCGWLDLHCRGLSPFTTVPAYPGACPNAGAQPLPKAGARHERTLEAVSSRRLLNRIGLSSVVGYNNCFLCRIRGRTLRRRAASDRQPCARARDKSHVTL